MLIFLKFLCEFLFDLVDLLKLCGQGTDTVSMGLQVGDSKGSGEKHVRLQLCFLASTLSCQFGWLIYPAIFLDMRADPSLVGWMLSLLIRPGLPQRVCQLSMNPTTFAGHHLDSQRLNGDMWLNISSLVRKVWITVQTIVFIQYLYIYGH